MKSRLKTFFLIVVFGLIGLLSNCGSLDNDDGDGGGHKIPIRPTSIASAIPAWSPDGEWIAIAWKGHPYAVPRGIHLIRPDGSGFHLLFSFNGFTPIIDLCWAPDGEWLAFNAYHEIWKIKANGDSLTQLTYSGENYRCTWSLSDTLIAFEHSVGDNYGTWLMDPNGDNQRHFIKNGGIIDFTLDDSLFYEISIGQGLGQMAMINTSDSSERVFYTMVAGKPFTTYYYPEVSPDGSEIALSIDNQIRKLTINGTNLQTLTVDGGKYPHWSPDGQYIVYCETDTIGYKVKIMQSDGSEKRLLIDFVELLPDSLLEY